MQQLFDTVELFCFLEVANIEIIGVRSVNVANWPDLGSRVDRLVGLSSYY